MELSADATIPFDRDRVFRAYRDDLSKLTEFLPNIRRIEVVEKEDKGSITEILNVWHGGGDIPSAARVVLSESMMSWKDYAIWNAEEYSCTWRIETNSFTEAMRCEGKNFFVETPEGTRLEIRGEIEIAASKISGVPKLLRSSVSKTVTEFLCKKITPNLIEVSSGLTRFLQRQDRAEDRAEAS